MTLLLCTCLVLVACPAKPEAPPIDYGSAYLGVAKVGVVEITPDGEVRRLTEPHAYYRGIFRRPDGQLLVKGASDLYLVGPNRTKGTRTTLPADMVSYELVSKGRRVFFQQRRGYYEYRRGGAEMEPIAEYSRDRTDGENFWFGAEGFQVDDQDRFWGFHSDRVVAATRRGDTRSSTSAIARYSMAGSSRC